MTRPIKVARGTLRLGFSITPADTAALSIPMYAHNAIEAAREIACASEPPLTFQPERKISGLNQNQPRNAIAKIGMSASDMVHISSAPMTRGPRMFANVNNQIRAAVLITVAIGVVSPGTSSAKYPI